MVKKLFTSESVTEGHPDKICDQISDAVLDAMLEQDPASRCACEVTATTGLVSVMGEITTNALIDIPEIVRSVLREVGYTEPNMGSTASPAPSSPQLTSSRPTSPWACIVRSRPSRAR